MKRPFGIVVAACVALGTAAAGSTAVSAAPVSSVAGNVAVLVVDDFGMGRDLQAKPGTKNDNCTVGASDVGSNGAGDDLPPTGYAHGELVYRVLRDSLTAGLGRSPVASATTPRPAPAPPTETSTEWSYPIGSADYAVRLVAVHTEKYRTEDILNEIRDRITALRRERFDRFVLNLSFVVVPCDVVGWLTNSDLNGLLKAYDTMIDNDPTGTLKTGLKSYLDAAGRLDPVLVRGGDFTTRVARDDGLTALRPYLAGAFYKTINITSFNVKERPLSSVYGDAAWQSFRSQLVQPGAAGARLRIIPVAAAGNGVKYLDPMADPEHPHDPAGLVRRGLPFPFAPALWDFVVSTGADAEAGVAARLNSGEVSLDATGPDLVPDGFGTSFAAPRLSALQAKYLAETGNVACGGTPPLGYVDLSTGPVPDLSVDSPWKNWGKAVWPGICGPFPA